MKIGGAFEHILELDVRPVEELWLDFKEKTTEITEKVVCFRRRKQVVNLPSAQARECEERRKARTEYLKNTSNAQKRERHIYKNKVAKKAIRTHNRKQPDIQVMEEDFKKNNSNNLFKYMRELRNKLCKHLMVVNNGDGNLKTDPCEVLKCWETYFKKHLNTNLGQRKGRPCPPTKYATGYL